MAQLAVRRPFDEGDLDDDLRTHPVRAHARQPDGLGERRLRDLERIEPRAELQQELRVEAGADLPGVDKVVVLALRLTLAGRRALSSGEVADEQRAQTNASALRIGEPADD